ncbi:MAG: hypothetical protein Q9160_006855 [Pyrenula sp. 1 TL-2023]
MPLVRASNGTSFVSLTWSRAELIRKISRALKATGGAATEYQHVTIELQALQRVLQQLESLQPTEKNANYVNAIRGLALACHLPLQDFLKKLSKYENSMGPFRPRSKFYGFKDKAQWAISVNKEVEKLRAFVIAKTLTPNKALNSGRESISRIENSVHDHSGSLKDHFSSTNHKIATVEDDVSQVKCLMQETKSSLETKMGRIESQTETQHNMIVSFRNLCQQIMEFLRSFPKEIRNTLGCLMQSNLQIFNHILQLQHTLANTPSATAVPAIHFLDALDRQRTLPWDIFHQWEPFEGLLKADFRGLSAEAQVLSGSYHLIDEKRKHTLISPEAWSQSIFPGARVSMSVILSALTASDGICPRQGCSAALQKVGQSRAPVKCLECNLVLYESSNNLEALLETSCLDNEEDSVMKQQLDEDTQTFGARNFPNEFIASEDPKNLPTGLANCKRHHPLIEPDRNDAYYPEAKKRITGTHGRAEPIISQIDWHGGKTPLDAWLSQSAVPVVGSSLHPVASDSEHVRTTAMVSQQIQALNILRRIHIARERSFALTKIVIASTSHTDDEERYRKALRPDVVTEVYLRNIQDRFPSIPLYLARRLAEANERRVLRLLRARQARDGLRQPQDGANDTADIHESATSLELSQLQYSDKPGTSLDSSIFQESLFSTGPVAAVAGNVGSGVNAHRPVSLKPRPIGQETDDEYDSDVYGFRFSQDSLEVHRPGPEQTQDFWSGKHSECSTRSEASWSSMNSELRMSLANLHMEEDESPSEDSDARHCSHEKPQDVEYWCPILDLLSEVLNRRFEEKSKSRKGKFCGFEDLKRHMTTIHMITAFDDPWFLDALGVDLSGRCKQPISPNTSGFPQLPTTFQAPDWLTCEICGLRILIKRHRDWQ